jgi:hypothetical protein
MNKIDINSLLVLLVPLAITVIGYFQPAINDFVGHNTWVIPVYASIIQVLNHFVTPVTQPKPDALPPTTGGH